MQNANFKMAFYGKKWHSGFALNDNEWQKKLFGACYSATNGSACHSMPFNVILCHFELETASTISRISRCRALIR